MIQLYPDIGHYIQNEFYHWWTRFVDGDPKYLAVDPAKRHEIPPGLFLAEVTSSEISSAAAAGNTGNGTVSFDAIYKPQAQIGTYVVKCITADPDVAIGSEIWEVYRPDGILLGTATTAVQFLDVAGGIDFTITAGATAFVVGDAFNLTVIYGLQPLDLSASNGTQTLVGINVNPQLINENYVMPPIIYRGKAIVDLERLYSIYENYTGIILTTGNKVTIVAALDAVEIKGV